MEMTRTFERMDKDKAWDILVEYMWENEEAHWIEEGRPNDHIFIALKTLNRFLNTTIEDDSDSDSKDKATCDVCGGLPTRRCFDCPYDHRSCDDCGCDEWQRLCDKGKDKESDDEPEHEHDKRIEESELIDMVRGLIFQ